MATLSCTVIGHVDLVKPLLPYWWIPDTQNKHGSDHGSLPYIELNLFIPGFSPIVADIVQGILNLVNQVLYLNNMAMSVIHVAILYQETI